MHYEARAYQVCRSTWLHISYIQSPVESISGYRVEDILSVSPVLNIVEGAVEFRADRSLRSKCDFPVWAAVDEAVSPPIRILEDGPSCACGQVLDSAKVIIVLVRAEIHARAYETKAMSCIELLILIHFCIVPPFKCSEIRDAHWALSQKQMWAVCDIIRQS